mgnify:FL=1
MKKFNTTAVCIPSKHYMVDLSERVDEIKKLVDDGKYFTINRARQYGKTTTLTALKANLYLDYVVVFLDFQGIGNSGFATEEKFVQEFSRLIWNRRKIDKGITAELLDVLQTWKNEAEPTARLGELFDLLSEWCEQSEKPIVLIIDEVDSATNNQVFLDFLAQLRDKYISRDRDGIITFQSVILAGVTDVKHLKSKIRPEDEHKENSPWNIAADFTIDMSLSEDGIKGMLDEYEADHNTGMNTEKIAKSIREYTNGYPFLVSRICQLIDTRFVPEKYNILAEAWTEEGVNAAVKFIVTEKNTLFDSLMGKLREYDHLRNQLRKILMQGETIEYLPDDLAQEQLMMYGFIINNHNTVAVANKIFEMRLYRYYLGESQFTDELRGDALDGKPEFIKNGVLDVRLIMERFINTQKYIRNIKDEEAEKKFIEEEGREKFLTYLSPIINGVGTFSIEEQTRDRKRMDVVIHYLGKRYIIEMKIWHGAKYNADGEEQVMGYLDRYGLDTGYMLSFSFNKNKEPGVKDVRFGDKLLIEGIV